MQLLKCLIATDKKVNFEEIDKIAIIFSEIYIRNFKNVIVKMLNCYWSKSKFSRNR